MNKDCKFYSCGGLGAKMLQTFRFRGCASQSRVKTYHHIDRFVSFSFDEVSVHNGDDWDETSSCTKGRGISILSIYSLHLYALYLSYRLIIPSFIIFSFGI